MDGKREGEHTQISSESIEAAPMMSSGDFALLFLTCFAAPLVSHLCDLIVGSDENPLSSEKLLCAYFVLIALYVIYENIVGFLKKTRLWHKGWRLGNSDALLIALYIAGATVVIGFYDTLPGVLVIVSIFAVLFVLLWFKPVSIRIDSRKMTLFALMVAIALPVAVLGVYGGDGCADPAFLIWIVVGQFVACALFDAVYVLLKKIDAQGKKKKA